MADELTLARQEEYLDKMRKLKQTEHDMKMFSDEMSQIYKKQDLQIVKLSKQIGTF